jgi:hypothetical protein
MIARFSFRGAISSRLILLRDFREHFDRIRCLHKHSGTEWDDRRALNRRSRASTR